MYKKDKEGLIVIVAAQKVDRTGRKEGIVLRSVRTQKGFAHTKEVDHLGNAKERSYYNHTASCASEEYCRSLVLEQGAAIKSCLYTVLRYKKEPYDAFNRSNLYIYGGRQLYLTHSLLAI